MNLQELKKRLFMPTLKEVLATGDYPLIRKWVILEVVGWLAIGFAFGSMLTIWGVRQGLIPI
jgi:hypothetical protein